MAISKERLKELIEQGATIYGIKDNWDEYLGFELYFDNIDLRPGYKIVDKEDGNKHLIFGVNNPIEIANLENLFETKEDAEFVLRYKRIPRTEYLDLPTWEEFNSEDKLTAFTAYPHNYHLLKVDNYIYLRSFYGQGGMDIFNKPLTKENYLEACEVARKLWLGEKV